MTLPWEEPVLTEDAQGVEVNDSDRSLVPLEVERSPSAVTTDHVITGLGMLAKMSDEEFNEKLEILRRGRERVETIQKNLMRKGVDYGTVPGIDRPFLHLPGAEALEKFYGYVAEQRTERFVGDGMTEPHLAYRTDTIVHLGDLAGPVVATVSASANSFEDRYRYRWENPSCPECGHELIKRKSPPQMAGKWNCPNWGGKGGCNRIFEPNDERIKPRQRVEYDNPHSNDETLIQMSQKRSYVAGIRRATGTSGIFTIDEDAPSVIEQSKNSGVVTDDSDVIGKPVDVGNVEAGGKQDKASTVQTREIVALSQEKDLGPEGIASLLHRLFDMAVAEDKRAVSTAVKSLTAAQAAQLIATIRTGELPDRPEDDKSIVLEADGMPV